MYFSIKSGSRQEEKCVVYYAIISAVRKIFDMKKPHSILIDMVGF